MQKGFCCDELEPKLSCLLLEWTALGRLDRLRCAQVCAVGDRGKWAAWRSAAPGCTLAPIAQQAFVTSKDCSVLSSLCMCPCPLSYIWLHESHGRAVCFNLYRSVVMSALYDMRIYPCLLRRVARHVTCQPAVYLWLRVRLGLSGNGNSDEAGLGPSMLHTRASARGRGPCTWPRPRGLPGQDAVDLRRRIEPTCPDVPSVPTSRLEAPLGHAGGHLSAILLALLQLCSIHCDGRIPDGSALQCVVSGRWRDMASGESCFE